VHSCAAAQHSDRQSEDCGARYRGDGRLDCQKKSFGKMPRFHQALIWPGFSLPVQHTAAKIAFASSGDRTSGE
jgi:hypothetical protein